MPIELIPRPVSVTEKTGGPFEIDDHTVLVATGRAEGAAWLLHDHLRAGTGLRTPVTDSADTNAITFGLAGDEPAPWTTAAEAYRIDVGHDAVHIEAAAPAGLIQAVHTLRQLMPADTLRAARVVRPPVQVPAVTIEDEPRFAWRGLMLDVARHFMPKSSVLRFIDLAAVHHLNVLHLHLTDDQGWRLPVPGWPKLTEISSWRTETVVGHAMDEKAYDGTPHGGYYTHDDLREIAAYAAARGVTVVPEVDLPGHVRSVLAAYPHLGNTGDHKPVATTFGIFSEVLAPTEEALRFCRDVFDTVAEIFPSDFVHIGGDECPRTEWLANETARARAAELGLSGPELLQSWFTRQFGRHLSTYDKTIVGWDEILDGGAPSDAVVMVWRDFDIAAQAIRKGHRVIVAPVQAAYLDYYPSDDPEEPLHIHGRITFEEIAGFEPVPEGADETAVLGVQAQLWTEYIRDSRRAEYNLFPRLVASADLAWSSADVRRAHPVAERLPAHVKRLDALGVNHRPLDGPHPWQQGGIGDNARFDPTGAERREVTDLPGM